MIIYDKKYFGTGLIFRVYGSAIVRAIPQAVLSVIFYFLLHFFAPPSDTEFTKGRYPEESDSTLGKFNDWYDHPYAVGVLITSCTFLITYRANFAYQRYWEAAGAVHSMMSKWMDSATQTGGFHMQSKLYDMVKPPTFHDHPQMSTNQRVGLHKRRSGENTKDRNGPVAKMSINDYPKDLKLAMFPKPKIKKKRSSSSHDSLSKAEKFGSLNPSLHDSSEITAGEPSPFLQELCHLFSLMNAVALATLRNDVDGAPSPLTEYVPCSPWPEVDPSKIPRKFKRSCCDIFNYILGFDRTDKMRTEYNASRPLGVFGGVSEAEILQLQAARGAYAKTTLCSMWLQEFIVREHLAGSLGLVGPPIISRLFQFLSDGTVGYNQARKIMWIPFPFPHAQIAALFTWIGVFCVPMLLLQYTNTLWNGSTFTFLTVLSLTGMHEVARELENPFRNNPNDLPLCTMQAQFNEALMTIFVGYHPDSWWNIKPPQSQVYCDDESGTEILACSSDEHV